MNPLHDFKQPNALRRFVGATMPVCSPAIAALLLGLLLPKVTHGDRLDDFNKLEAECKTASESFFKEHKLTASSPAAERIAAHKAIPTWKYIPRFLALAEASPADDTSYRACEWLLDCPASDKVSFAAQQKAWQIIAINHSQGPNLPRLCLRTVQTCGVAEEEFLRGVLRQPSLSRENAAFATVALGEVLARRHSVIENRAASPVPPPADEFEKYYRDRIAPEWRSVFEPQKAAKYRTESEQLFHAVLDKYGDVP